MPGSSQDPNAIAALEELKKSFCAMNVINLAFSLVGIVLLIWWNLIAWDSEKKLYWNHWILFGVASNPINFWFSKFYDLTLPLQYL